MTNSQFAQVLKAATRAHAQGCHIIARCTDKATGTRFWSVAGSQGGIYQVVQISEKNLTCTCQAGQNGHYCKHRAIVTLRLKEEAALRADYEESMVDDLDGLNQSPEREIPAGALKNNARRFYC
jgi:hypothetical protein